MIGLMMFLGANLAAIGSPEDPGEDTITLSARSLAFAGGDGSAANPFQISNVTELQNMSANVTAHYKLKNDIDATSTSTWDNGAGFLPVGNATSKFNGSLDGNDHTITGLYIERRGISHVGLFGYNDGARVSNLTLSSATIKGSDIVGAIAGESIGGSIENCTVTGSVHGMTYLGGIVGVLGGDIMDCVARPSVSGRLYVGGMVGSLTGAITRCSSHGKVTGDYQYVGGLVGNIAGGTVSESHCDGAVEMRGYSCSYAGGFAGYSSGTISSCYSTGSLLATPWGSSSYSLGAFLGHNKGAVSKCYSLGSISVTVSDDFDAYIYYLGGFVGYNEGSVNYSYAKGSVKGSSTLIGTWGMDSSCSNLGGFAGYNRGTISHSYSSGPTVGHARGYDFATVSSLGGFTGNNGGTISNCYSTGTIRGEVDARSGRIYNCGGLVGFNSLSISYCYSTGGTSTSLIGAYARASSIGGFYGYTGRVSTACFWDTDTSGTTMASGSGTTSGVTGKTTIEMMTRSTFEDAAWDFNDTWVMIENMTYPHLRAFYELPIIDIYDHQMVVEDVPVTVSYDVSISDYPMLNQEKWVVITFDASAWLTWNETTRSFKGTPTNSEVGTYWINISAGDLCGGIGWNNVSLDVLNVNDPPVITTADVDVAPEDALYSVDYDALDVDPTNDTLTWNVSTTADWLTLNATTGRLTGMPTNDLVGAYSVTISVSDGNGGVDARTFMLVVENTNDDPVINSVDLETSVEDEVYSVHYHATDVDPTSDVLTWEVVTDAPWLTMTENNLIGTPGNEHVGTHWVNVTVSDGNGGEDSTNFTLTVNNVNDPPVITTVDVAIATEDELYSVDYDSDDIDATADEASWRLETEAGWLDVDQATGVLSGTPTNEDVGAFMVTVRVLDGRGGRDVRSFMLTVENTNDDPEITTTPVDRTEEDQVYTLFLEASDVDPTRDTFAWSLDTDAEWLSLTGNRLTGVPENDDVGEYRVAISVEDGQGGNDSLEYTLSVRNTNDPPVIVSTPLHAREDEAYSFTMEAQDPDVGDALQWSLGSPVGWLSIDTASGEMAGTPTNDDVGSTFVMIVVTDGTSQVSKGFTIVVTNTNDAPEWLEVPEDVTIDAGGPVIQRAMARDVDGDAVTYAITSEPAAEGLVIAVTSGEIAWYETKAGTYQVTVTASDGDEEVEHTFTLTVTKVTTEEVEGGNGGFYAIILVLLVLVVVLILKMMMGGGEGPAPVGEEKAGTEDEVADEDEMETDVEDEMVDGPEEEQIIDP